MPIWRADSKPYSEGRKDTVSTSPWLPIRYRDFYDLPRSFVFEYAGSVYFFDCPFDEATDEYTPDYSVYRLPPEVVPSLERASWEGLAKQGRFVRNIPVESVRFDPTKRSSIDSQLVSFL